MVEAMASLETAYAIFGDDASYLMDRVERLAFNALPAALTSDMWTHVYVQQANSVFAGRTHPTAGRDDDTSRRSHDLHYQHDHQREERRRERFASCLAQQGENEECLSRMRNETISALRDMPSGEDQTANFYGVSHFPCCVFSFAVAILSCPMAMI